MVHTKVAAQTCNALEVHGSVFERFPAHETRLGTLEILRALPLRPGGTVSVFAGSVPGGSSPAKHFSPILGADIALHEKASMDLQLDPSFEHAVLLMTGDAEIDGQSIDATGLWFLGTNRSGIKIKSRSGCRVLLLGGLPFPEKILMWWNFVARTPEEIAQARTDWQSHQRFGEVRAYRGPRLNAPPLQRFAPPNPAS